HRFDVQWLLTIFRATDKFDRHRRSTCWDWRLHSLLSAVCQRTQCPDSFASHEKCRLSSFLARLSPLPVLIIRHQFCLTKLRTNRLKKRCLYSWFNDVAWCCCRRHLSASLRSSVRPYRPQKADY